MWFPVLRRKTYEVRRDFCLADYLNLSWELIFVSMSSYLKTVHKRHKRDTTGHKNCGWQLITYWVLHVYSNRHSYLIISVTSLRRRGHFRVPKSLTFKTRLSENLSHENESFLLKNKKNHYGIALILALKQRLGATWKFTGPFLSDLFWWPRILEEKMHRLLSVNFWNVESITARTSPVFT